MSSTQVTDIFRDGIGVAIKIAAPMLLMSMVVGVVVAILQAVTQIHEQSISFLLKVIVVVLFLVLGGSWMMQLLQEYALELFDQML